MCLQRRAIKLSTVFVSPDLVELQFASQVPAADVVRCRRELFTDVVSAIARDIAA
jgi:hypothetical protein